ncbi:MAG TPA: DUF4129 domain-containing protein [Burkholderiales bacterium]|nr:DUF4129 domain-containing protein [Burkholderiales bacterium]
MLKARPRYLLLLGLLSCVLAAPIAWAAADADEVGRRLNRCLSALDAEAEPVPAYRRLILEEVCPGLARAVAELPAAGSLSQPLDHQTTPNQLHDLRALLGSYRSPPAGVERFDFAALPELLARTLQVEPAPPVSWWQRFKDWLAQKLRGSHETDYRWLTEFLKSLDPPEWLEDLILRASVAVILLLALAVVVNELRAANLASWLQRRNRTQHASRVPAATGAARLTWKDVATLSPGQQPAALLRLVLQELIERGLLPDDQSLTNREMLARLGAAARAHAAPFAELAAAADAVLFGNRVMVAAQLAPLQQAAQAIVGTPMPGAAPR